MQKEIRLNSFSALADIQKPEKKTPAAWETFLSERGQTKETFVNLPEHVKMSMQFSFAKRSSNN